MADESNDQGNKRPQRFGRFEELVHIASGGMGAVYKARDPLDDSIVALKVMSPELAKKKNMIARFKGEAQAAAKLRHKNIVAIHEFGEANGTYYLALEYVDGKDLHDYITRSPGRRLGVEEARHIALQAAYALDHAHQAGIVHRDIKPSNFLIVQQPDMPLVKLTDFGLARRDDDEEHRVTKVGTTLGTVDYMAPEQARDSYKADIRSDMYALGCTLFHMLAGKPPFPKGTLAERLMMHIETEPPDICSLNEAVPKTLGMIVRHMMAKDPRQRYQTPAELIFDLENPDQVKPFKELAPEKKARKAPERNVAEVAEPAKKPSSVVAQRKKPKKKQTQAWLPWAIGGGVAAVAALIIAVVLGNRQPPEKKPIEEVKPPVVKIEPIVKPPPIESGVGPPAPALKPLYQPLLPLEPEALTKEFFAGFADVAAPPDAKVILVSRLPASGAASVRTLAEALAQTTPQRTTVIEIRDQGPHFLSSLPAAQKRHLWIRGGLGIRPLLVWDGAGGSNLLRVDRGNLTLENLDVGVYLPENPPGAPLTLFHVRGGDVQARHCTFSTAGRHPGGIVVVRLQGSESAGADAGQDGVAAEVKCRFSRCMARGHDVVLLATENASADVLIDGSLAAGGAQPLLFARNRDEDALTLRIVRSTLTAQQQLLRWQGPPGKGGTPRLKILAWDALLARSEATTPEGDMLHVADGARSSLMGCKPINCVYAGWKNLLVAGDKTLDTLSAWRSAWGHREGDLAIPETWPPRNLGALDDLAPAQLLPHDTPAAFTATSGRGALGCEIGRLPPEPLLWKQRTFERFVATEVALPDAEAPEIPAGPAGEYHGERIELGKVDLGDTVQARLRTLKAGPRIVLHLAGKGKQLTGPLRFRGVQQVVIYFEQPPQGGKDKAEPLTLELKSGSQAEALIDVEDGSLEIQHARFRYENSRIAALPAHMIRVRGGDLRLNRCTLLGPLSKAPDSFQSLILCEGAGLGAAAPVTVALRECTLQSGKAIVELRNPGVRLRCRGCLLYSLGDVLSVELGTLVTSRPDIVAAFENNTIAHRQAFVHLRCFEAPSNCQPVVLQTQANYFLDPFADEPRQAVLTRISADSLARGLFAWQGKRNVFARDRLPAYFTAAELPVVGQPFKEWEHLVGPFGETEELHVDAIAGKGYAPDQPPYDRLILPPTVRLEPQPGADLVMLGLVKKK